MVEFTHRDVERGAVAVGNRKVSLVETETKVKFTWGSGGWAWTYRRPKTVAMSDDPESAVPLRDHVMLAKIALVLVTIAMLIRRG